VSVSILFVCLGNICRSPMAEAVMRDLVAKEELEGKVRIDSAGTGDWHVGSPPHRGTRRVLDRHGISYEGIAARQLVREDGDRFDWIVAMDASNERDIRAIIGPNARAAVLRLLSLVPGKEGEDVPDPYYSGRFDEVYELVREGCGHLLALVRKRLEGGLGA